MAQDLRFNVAQLLRDTAGSSRDLLVATELDALVPDLSDNSNPASAAGAILSGPVRLINTDTGVLAQGRLLANAILPCARCLEPVTVTLSVELEEVFTPTIDILTGKSIMPDEEDRSLWIDQNHVLDLTDVLRQNVLLALPVHVLCRSSCRGLCPACGKNLNEGPCDCRAEGDPRWGPLTDLLKPTA